VSEERLQKLLARSGIASRRQAEELLREGRVTVNGRVAELGGKADPQRDAVKVDGRRVVVGLPAHAYLLLNKPRGVMSTTSDPEGRPTVLDLVPPGLRRALVPVGRLDFATEGLLLLTDDGEFAHRVSHPRYGCTKTYEVKVSGIPEPKAMEKLRAGIVLEGRRTAPCRIEPRRPAGGGRRATESSWWTVELAQGRTRQIREMFFRIGHPVEKLRRVAIGALTDPQLPVGAARELTPAEVQLLLRGPRTARRPPRRQPAPSRSLRPESPRPRAARRRAPAGRPIGRRSSRR
jgi:23S rRNA pseudouridine2605 synthase